MNQPALPFSESRLPGWVPRAFAVANASSAPWKENIFYPFKDWFLQERGVADGWDHQIIKHECWTCNGSGVWRRDYSGYKDVCNRCWGTGIYRTTNVVLWRYELGGYVFHRPDRGPRPESSPKSVITCYIRHESSGWWKATLCALALFIVYDRRLARDFLPCIVRNAPANIPVWSWVKREIFQAIHCWYLRNQPYPESGEFWPDYMQNPQQNEVPF